MAAVAAIELKMAAISAARLAELAYAPFKNQFSEKEIQVDFNIPYSLPLLQCDIAKSAWVLSIFFSNAVRYTPQWGKLSVRAALETDRIRIAVENSGYGIPPEQLPRMFEPPTNLDAPEYGRGLALLLATEIIEAHGGRIGAYSEVGVLTGFYAELPISKG